MTYEFIWHKLHASGWKPWDDFVFLPGERYEGRTRDFKCLVSVVEHGLVMRIELYGVSGNTVWSRDYSCKHRISRRLVTSFVAELWSNLAAPSPNVKAARACGIWHESLDGGGGVRFPECTHAMLLAELAESEER